VTLGVEAIERGVAALAAALRDLQQQDATPPAALRDVRARR
jgi:hypothetical protein